MNRLWLGLLIAAFSLAACGTSSTPAPTLTPTPIETPIAEPTTFAGQGVLHGELLFNTTQVEAGFACATCHYHDSEARLIGPGLARLNQRFEAYVLDMSFEEYLLESILHPNTFLAPGEPAYKEGLMPANYGEIFTEQELEDLIAYLLTL